MTPLQELSQRTLSVDAIRRVDRVAIDEFHMHSLVLMENAAIGCAQWMIDRLPSSRRCTLLCGRGNNGGDGFAIARHLQLAGWDCHVVAVGPTDKFSSDALANWNILTAGDHRDRVTLWNAESNEAEHERIDQRIATADVIVDAMLGTGASGEPRAPFDHWIEYANQASGKCVAIDIPTGLDAQSGETASKTFKAHCTLTFVALKQGFHTTAAQRVLGDIHVLPIGIPQSLVERLLLESNGNRSV